MVRKTHRLRNTLLPLIVALLIIGGIGLALHQRSADTAHQPASTGNNQGINYGPPTAADQAMAENNKSQPPSNQASTTTNSGKSSVQVDITTWNSDINNFSVNGLVTGAVETGGTCTLILKNGGTTVTETRLGESAGTNTTCGKIGVPASKLHAGTWQAVLSYSSSKFAGTSSPVNIEVK